MAKKLFNEKYQIVFSILLILLLSSSVTATNSCIKALFGSLGTYHSTQAQGEFYLLGKGAIAEVFRVITTSGEIEIHKVYTTLDSLNTDLASLGLFKHIISSMSASDELVVPRILRVDKETLTVVFENHQGEILEDVVNKNLSTTSQREAWIKQYLAIRDRINAYIVENFRGKVIVNALFESPSEVFSMRSFILKINSEYLPLVIKPDNVLVTNDGKLILFDPF